MPQNVTLTAGDWNMSKGIGGLQRALLAAIQEHGCINTLEVARHAYKIEPCDTVDGVPYHYINDAQHAATRRALAGLAKRGLIVNLGRGFRDLGGSWAGRVLWCTPLYAEEYRAKDMMHHHHRRHHSEPPPDPTHALSFWD
jgi:hypothetical protein